MNTQKERIIIPIVSAHGEWQMAVSMAFEDKQVIKCSIRLEKKGGGFVPVGALMDLVMALGLEEEASSSTSNVALVGASSKEDERLSYAVKATIRFPGRDGEPKTVEGFLDDKVIAEVLSRLDAVENLLATYPGYRRPRWSLRPPPGA